MITKSQSMMDADSKRWLVFLAITAVASAIFMTYAFVKTLSAPQQSVAATQNPTPASTQEEAATREPDWNAAQGERQGSLAATTRPDPFAAQEAAAAKAAARNDPVAAQQAVHRQAEYFRTLISEGKLPECYGKLTKEQVDEMEKKGLMIN